MPYRIILWGTGFVGSRVLHEIIDHPDFDLAAVIVSDPAKDGRDAGELGGGSPIGIAATTDVEAALATAADVVAYYGPTAAQAGENIRNICAALRAGKNVVSTAMTPWVYPPAAPRHEIEPVERACLDGGVSCFTTGIDPGFANDLLPLTLMGVCGRVDSVRVQEILDYSTYTGSYEPTGLGDPVDQTALLETPEILIYAWGHTVPMIAAAAGIELEQIDTTWLKWAATERIVFPHGVIEPGHTAAVRFEIRGWYGGEPRIIVEHVNRITNAAAPDWPRATSTGNDVYRVEIKGSPDITQETYFRGARDGDANSGGCLSTGMRALNAVPAVVAAPPGLISALDLPLIGGHGTIR